MILYRVHLGSPVEGSTGIALLLCAMLVMISCREQKTDFFAETASVLRDTILLHADRYLLEEPITVTAAVCPRSEGGLHDFYSEGDYWWPDESNPDGPYIRRDGMTNPANFVAHRLALVRLGDIVGNLTSAYLLSKDDKYAAAAGKHLSAWFVDAETKMNPHLLYAQAIKGRHTGRGIGIIDAIHFMEVVRSAMVLDAYSSLNDQDLAEMRDWFSAFVTWLVTHEYGRDEMVHPNNHGMCWNMQVGLFARFTDNKNILDFCRENYKNSLLPSQMAEDGSFPLEIERTKPYGYSLFNLDAMTMNCMVLSDQDNDLWNYSTADGRSIKKGLEFMKPYVADKSSWPYKPDVMYWDEWPVGHPSFLFGGVYFGRRDYFELWKKYKHFYEVVEVKRNMPIRNPLIWLAEV